MQQVLAEELDERLGGVRLPIIAVGLEIGLRAAKKILLRGELRERWCAPRTFYLPS